MYPDCAVAEKHSDRMQITQNPVETGAAITDHAFKVPPTVQLRWSWSNGSPRNALASGIGPSGVLGFGSEQYINQVYQSLLALQVSAVPFKIVTGRRMYANMLLASLEVETDPQTAYVLMVEAECKAVLLVSTQAATGPAPSPSGDPSAQQFPQQTSAVTNTGSNPPVQQKSLLLDLYNMTVGPSGGSGQ